MNAVHCQPGIDFSEFQSMLADSHCRDFFAVRGLQLHDAQAFFEMMMSMCDLGFLSGAQGH